MTERRCWEVVAARAVRGSEVARRAFGEAVMARRTWSGRAWSRASKSEAEEVGEEGFVVVGVTRRGRKEWPCE